MVVLLKLQVNINKVDAGNCDWNFVRIAGFFYAWRKSVRRGEKFSEYKALPRNDKDEVLHSPEIVTMLEFLFLLLVFHL